MNWIKYSWLLLIIIIASTSCNQTKSTVDGNAGLGIPSEDRSKIEATIQTYFDGWLTGDTTKLGKAMHATCQLKNIKDDGVVIYSRAKYLGFFKPRPPLENAGGQILSIDITDDIAAAKCQLYTKDRLFTDYFNMMKLGEDWYIVDKIATNKPHPKNQEN